MSVEETLLECFPAIDILVIRTVLLAAEGDCERASVALLAMSETLQSEKSKKRKFEEKEEHVVLTKKTACPSGSDCLIRTTKHLQKFSHQSSGDSEKKIKEKNSDRGETAKKQKTAAVVTRESCAFGKGCYRKNPAHFEQLAHPGDADFAERSESTLPAYMPSLPSSPDITCELADEDDAAEAARVEKFLSAMRRFQEQEESENALKAKSSSFAGGTFAGLVICMTGTLSKTRAEMTQWIEENGGTVCSSVTGSVTHLVCENPHSGSSKLVKARANGVSVVGEHFLHDRLAGKKASGGAAGSKEGAAVAAAGKEKLRRELMIGDVAPLHLLRDGESVQVQSSSSDVLHTLKRVFDHFYCTCVSWKNQRAAVDQRTCKHLRAHLGAEYERLRVGGEAGDAAGGGGGLIRVAKGAASSGSAKKSAPSLLLAHKFDIDGRVDPTGWHISEKLDGVRCFWDGESLLSRNGIVFCAPQWFVDALPRDVTLDGELFCGRGKFSDTVSIVRTRGDDERWKTVKFMVFDIPSADTLEFEKRQEKLAAVVAAANWERLVHVHQNVCRSAAHLKSELKAIELKGGEGLMLRQPRSLYVGSRSRTLLKVKSFHDIDVVVIAHERGKGKYSHCTGALRCKTADGVEFKVGSGMSDHDRENPPSIGSVIVVRYQELTASKTPRFPTFVGIRGD